MINLLTDNLHRKYCLIHIAGQVCNLSGAWKEQECKQKLVNKVSEQLTFLGINRNTSAVWGSKGRGGWVSCHCNTQSLIFQDGYDSLYAIVAGGHSSGGICKQTSCPLNSQKDWPPALNLPVSSPRPAFICQH